MPEALIAHRELEAFRARVPERLATTVAAQIGTKIVGFVTVKDDEIEQLYVADSVRGSGVADALLTDGERAILARYSVAWLAVVAGNTRARRFYERNGWRDASAVSYAAQIANGSLVVPSRRYEKSFETGQRDATAQGCMPIIHCR